jgi:hypothetical protein
MSFSLTQDLKNSTKAQLRTFFNKIIIIIIIIIIINRTMVIESTNIYRATCFGYILAILKPIPEKFQFNIAKSCYCN